MTTIRARIGSSLLPAAVAAAVLAVGLLGGCRARLAPVEGELEENLARWREAGIESYAYDYRLACFCAGPGTIPVRIEVRDGVVTAVAPLEPDAGGPVDEPGEFPTVEDLFARLGEALERDPHEVDVLYDPELGYPREAFIDFIEHAIDEELGFEASGLEPL